MSSILASNRFYAGGGGGHSPGQQDPGRSSGGLGGGGQGGRWVTPVNADDGAPNTGGGGGGSYGVAGSITGLGGSGIVVVRYRRNASTTVSPTETRPSFLPFFYARDVRPIIARDGLVLELDAANPLSYPGSGTTWTDLSGNGNNGTLVNGVGYNSSNLGLGSLSFDGVDDFITVSTTGIYTNVVTIDIWFNVNSSKTYTALLGSNVAERCEMLIKSASNLEISLSGGNYIQHNSILSINTWTNIVVVATSGTAWKVYKNGVELGTPQIIAGSYQVNGSGITNLDQGRIRNDVVTFAYSGLIGLTKIYNRTLTASEILQNFNATRARYGV
jgi:hypothetical protein